MSTAHDELWARLLSALSLRDALPSDNATPSEIASHAGRLLMTDVVHRFVHEYYYKMRFGATDGVLSEREAAALVAQIEAMPVHPSATVRTESTTTHQPASRAEPKNAPKAHRPTREPQEAFGVGDCEEQRPTAGAVAPPTPRTAQRESASPQPEPPPEQPMATPVPEPTPGDPASQLTSAQARMEAGDHPAAVALFESYLRKQPDALLALQQLAYCLGQMGKNQQALDLVNRAIVLAPLDAPLWNNLGVYRQRLGLNDTALDAFREASRLCPTDAHYQRNLGRLLQKREQFSAAAAAFRQAVALDSHDSDSLLDAARCLDHAGQIDSALDTTRTLLEQAPTRADARNYLGHLLYKRNDFANAAIAFKMAAETASTEPIYWENFSLVLKRLGRLAEADAAQEQANALRQENSKTRRNWVAFVELLIWLAVIAWLATWLGTDPPVDKRARIALVLGLIVVVGVLLVRVMLQRSMRGGLICLAGAAFVIHIDISSYPDFMKLDLATWKGLLQGAIGGLFALGLNASLLIIPFFLRGRS